MKKYRPIVLANGLRVILIPQASTKALTTLLLCRVGSRYESLSQNGVSHFIEHLVFKGTQRRPTTLDLSKALDRVGAEYNAYTSKDHTGFFIKVSSRRAPLALDLLSDMLFYSRFDPAEIDRERGVILEEINMYEDNPLLYCQDLLEELVFGRQHPLGQLIIGPRQVIKKIARPAILNYRDRFYDPANMVLVLAGKLPPAPQKLVARYFNQSRQLKKFPAFNKFQLHQSRPRCRIRYQKTEQVQLALGFPAFPYQHRLLPAEN